MSREEQPGVEGKKAKTAVCAKCGHENIGRSRCEKCGAGLFIVCPDCHHRNSRSLTDCAECGRRLHKSWWRKLKRKLVGKGDEVTPFLMLLIVGAAILVLGMIIWLGGSAPVPEE